MNIPRNYSSSSCSSDDECEYVEEIHYDKRCKYERHPGNINGHYVCFHIRLCNCGEFDDKRYLRRRIGMYLEGKDGVDIRFCRSCKWIRTKERDYGQRVFILSSYCDNMVESQYSYNGTPYAMNNAKVAYD